MATSNNKPRPRPTAPNKPRPTSTSKSTSKPRPNPAPKSTSKPTGRPTPSKGSQVAKSNVRPEKPTRRSVVQESKPVVEVLDNLEELVEFEEVDSQPLPDPTKGMTPLERKRWQKKKKKEAKRQAKKNKRNKGTADDVVEGEIFELEDDLDMVIDFSNEVAKNEPKKKKKSIKFKVGIALLLVVLFVVGVIVAYGKVMNPKTSDVEDSLSGSHALLEWEKVVNSGSSSNLASAVDGSYLAKEQEYAGDSIFKKDFYMAVMGTVTYKVPETELLKANGEPVIVNGSPKMVTSDLMAGESVQLTTVDWTKLNFNKEAIIEFKDKDEKLKTINITADSSYAMQELFAAYVTNAIRSPKPGEAVVSTQEWVPQLEAYEGVDSNGNPAVGMRVSAAEDIALDNKLFGSKDFLDAQARFYSAYFNTPVPDNWLTYIKDTEAKKAMPTSYQGTINPNWIGAYRLQSQIVTEGKASGTAVKPIFPAVGDGTKENPAGLNTSIRTNIGNGEESKPIRIELTEFKQGQDAIDVFNSKDSRNFGFSTESQRVYISGKIQVTNISMDEITVKEDTAIVDDQLNKTASTGTVYGLKREATLKAGESIELDFWASSTEINSRYLIWGKSYNREQPVIWFKVLNAEDGIVESQQVTATPSGGTRESS